VARFFEAPMTSKTRKKSSARGLQRASTLLAGSAEQVHLVMDRISQSACLECGGPREGGGNFCAACLSEYPKETDVAEPFRGWRYCVRQKGPAIPGLDLFEAVRIGIYEYEGRSRFIAICQTFEEAKQAALKVWERSIAATERYYL
jgi:hypothetical protein